MKNFCKYICPYFFSYKKVKVISNDDKKNKNSADKFTTKPDIGGIDFCHNLKAFKDFIINGTEIKVRLGIVHGDITNEQTDYIVNAANSQLRHGSGVAGAIRIKGGPEIQKSSNSYINEHGSVKAGECAKIYVKGNLPCKLGIIHAVGPVWDNGLNGEKEVLANCFLNSMLAANDGESISIPAISSGIFGFPKESCAKIFFEQFIKFIQMDPQSIGRVRYVFSVNYDEETVDIFLSEFERMFKDWENKESIHKNMD